MSLSTFFVLLLLTLQLALVGGSLLSLSSRPHWFIRGWDFPRVQIVVVGWLLAIGCFLAQSVLREQVIPMWTCGAIAVALTGFHGFYIYPYTPLGFKQSAGTDASRMAYRKDPSTLRVVISNVELENQQYEKWMETMCEADPDVVMILEPDQQWLDRIEPLRSNFEYQISQPQDNWYGMSLLSKLPIEEHQIRFVVQDDIPSIDAKMRMDDGTLIRVIAVHPRPPEPIRGTDATPRDAELTLWGKELASDEGPIIIGGDLNDVAWSQTTKLFLRASQLLDPRRGRGFFNSFHAQHLWMRFPLDHIFHSNHFTVSCIKRLGYVGSDHFPILIDLRYDPSEKDEHDVMEKDEGDEEEMEERIERAEEDKRLKAQPVDDAVQSH